MSVMTRNTNLHLHLMPRACLTVETPEKTYSTVGACSCLPPVQTSIVEVSTTLEQAGSRMPPQFPPSKCAEQQPFRVLGLSTPSCLCSGHLCLPPWGGNCGLSLLSYSCQQVRRKKRKARLLSWLIPGKSSAAGFSSESWEAF